MPNINEKNNKHQLQRTAFKLFVIVPAFVCRYVHIENWNVRASDVCGRQSKRYWWEKHKLLKYEPQKHRSTANQMKWSISKSKWVRASEKENGLSMQTSVLLCFFCSYCWIVSLWFSIFTLRKKSRTNQCVNKRFDRLWHQISKELRKSWWAFDFGTIAMKTFNGADNAQFIWFFYCKFIIRQFSGSIERLNLWSSWDSLISFFMLNKSKWIIWLKVKRLCWRNSRKLLQFDIKSVVTRRRNSWKLWLTVTN